MNLEKLNTKKFGTDVPYRIKEGVATDLETAVENNDLVATARYLDEGANPNAFEKSPLFIPNLDLYLWRKPLAVAYMQSNLDMIALLKDYGADIREDLLLDLQAGFVGGVLGKSRLEIEGNGVSTEELKEKMDIYYVGGVLKNCCYFKSVGTLKSRTNIWQLGGELEETKFYLSPAMFAAIFGRSYRGSSLMWTHWPIDDDPKYWGAINWEYACDQALGLKGWVNAAPGSGGELEYIERCRVWEGRADQYLDKKNKKPIWSDCSYIHKPRKDGDASLARIKPTVDVRISDLDFGEMFGVKEVLFNFSFDLKEGDAPVSKRIQDKLYTHFEIRIEGGPFGWVPVGDRAKKIQLCYGRCGSVDGYYAKILSASGGPIRFKTRLHPKYGIEDPFNKEFKYSIRGIRRSAAWGSISREGVFEIVGGVGVDSYIRPQPTPDTTQPVGADSHIRPQPTPDTTQPVGADSHIRPQPTPDTTQPVGADSHIRPNKAPDTTQPVGADSHIRPNKAKVIASLKQIRTDLLKRKKLAWVKRVTSVINTVADTKDTKDRLSVDVIKRVQTNAARKGFKLLASALGRAVELLTEKVR